MPWIQQAKDISITSTTGHASSSPSILGRALATGGIHFTPFEFFVAAARCSYLHYINPALVTPESLMIAALVEQYIDDVNPDFAILPTANRFKDFLKSSFSGTVAAALSYLTMIQNGYVWADHFENVVGGNAAAAHSPDFVFVGHGVGTALVESKGTRAAGRVAFDSKVEAGYLSQVEPHLGHLVQGVMATHGYCIGSWLTSTTKAELFVHHTVMTPASIGGGGDNLIGLGDVQRNNYASAMTLVAGPQLGAEIRRGVVGTMPMFVRVHWRGRQWLTTLGLGSSSMGPSARSIMLYSERWQQTAARVSPRIGFAIDEGIATALLQWLPEGQSAKGRRTPMKPLSIERLPDYLVRQVRDTYEREPAAILPDGLAMIGSEIHVEQIELVRWNGLSFKGVG